MKRTLKRELKVLEIAKREALETSGKLNLSSTQSQPTSLCLLVGNSSECLDLWVVVGGGERGESRSIRVLCGRKGGER